MTPMSWILVAVVVVLGILWWSRRSANRREKGR